MEFKMIIRFGLILLISLICFNVYGQDRVDSTKGFLKLDNGNVLFGNVELIKSFMSKPKILFNYNDEYEVKEVNSFKNKEGYFRKYMSSGSFSIDKLVKRTTKGNIDLYSDNVISYTHSAAGPSFATTHYTEVYFSKNNGKLLEINYDNLFDNLSDNAESISYLKQYKTLKWVKLGVGLTGLGFVIAGLTQFDKEEGMTSKAKSNITLGVIIANLAWIPHFMQGGKMDKAIDVYNR